MTKSANNAVNNAPATSTTSEAENAVPARQDAESPEATTEPTAKDTSAKVNKKPKKKPSRTPNAGHQTPPVVVIAEPQELPEDITVPIAELTPLFPDLRDNYDSATISAYQDVEMDRLPKPKIAFCPGNPAIHGKVIDGTLTIKALKKLGKTSISCQYILVIDEKDAYKKAVKANCCHGKQLNYSEKSRSAKKLRENGSTQDEIAGILSVSQPTISRMLTPSSPTQAAANTGLPRRRHTTKAMQSNESSTGLDHCAKKILEAIEALDCSEKYLAIKRRLNVLLAEVIALTESEDEDDPQTSEDEPNGQLVEVVSVENNAINTVEQEGEACNMTTSDTSEIPAVPISITPSNPVVQKAKGACPPPMQKITVDAKPVRAKKTDGCNDKIAMSDNANLPEAIAMPDGNIPSNHSAST